MLTPSELAAAIEPLAPRLGERARRRLYEDPFWVLRYGERGVRLSREDGDFHLKYLCQALKEGDAGLLARYGVWLRTLLVSRGMCSRHLADNFTYLGDELRSELPAPEAELASSYLDAAVRALEYSDGPARALSARAAQVLGRVERELVPASPAVSREVASATSYLADALAAGRPDLFTAYLELLRSSEEFALSARVDELLAALSRAVLAELEEAPARAALAIIDQAPRRRVVA
jgi:hypothetical protein